MKKNINIFIIIIFILLLWFLTYFFLYDNNDLPTWVFPIDERERISNELNNLMK